MDKKLAFGLLWDRGLRRNDGRIVVGFVCRCCGLFGTLLGLVVGGCEGIFA